MKSLVKVDPIPELNIPNLELEQKIMKYYPGGKEEGNINDWGEDIYDMFGGKLTDEELKRAEPYLKALWDHFMAAYS